MSRRTLKKLLLSLVAIGILATVGTGGTYAIFQNEESNLNSNAASGTLTLNNLVGASSCDSQSSVGTTLSGTENYNTKESSPASTACTALFTTSTLQYPGTLTQIHVTLKNTGSVDAAKLYLFMPGTSAGLGCVESDNTTGGAVLGHGHPCGATGDRFYVEEDTSGWSALSCKYPAGAGACSITGGGTLNDFSTNYWKYAGAKLDLGAEPNQTVALKAQDSRYFTIGIEENSADNTLQGETATFSLTWHMDTN